jgi:cytochrome c oxidase subunit 2
LLALVTIGYGLRQWFPALASEHGAGIDLMMNYLLTSTGLLFLTGHLVLGYVVWRFTRASKVTLRLASPKMERRWSLVFAVLMTVVAEGGVLVLGLPVWNRLHATPPADAVTIEVTAEQFAWNFRYAGADGQFGRSAPRLFSENNPVGIDKSDPAAKDDLLLLGTMYLPVNRPAHIQLRSKDVLHSFFLPNFRVKQDAVPGMTIDFWFVPTKVGTYELACAELCGFAHYNMRGVIYVVSEEEFRQWLKSEPPFFS